MDILIRVTRCRETYVAAKFRGFSGCLRSIPELPLEWGIGRPADVWID